MLCSGTDTVPKQFFFGKKNIIVIINAYRMAPDFDTLRRMWRCHALRIASFYKLAYDPPNDMPELWRHMENTHSHFSYSEKPSFPIEKTPDEAEHYIDECARAFLHYKDTTKKHIITTPINAEPSSHRPFSIIYMTASVVALALGCVLWHKKKTTMCIAVVAFFMVIVPLVATYSEIKNGHKTHRNRNILLYKDTPDKDISYIEDHLPPKFGFTDIADKCDFILSTKFVWGERGFEPHQTFLTEYGKQPKKVIIFWITDNNDVFEVPSNVYFFRTSMYRRWRNPTEDILPFVFEPFDGQEFQTLAHTTKPIIGFCGAVWPNRKPTLDKFKKDDRFQTLYIEHAHFSAGTREIYLENILNSHFTICDRGAGNFTMRFWHVLSVGRIPILVDDDMVWPFAREIDWDNLCIRAHDLVDLAEKTNTFYHTHKIEDVQKQCMQTYHLYFTHERYLDKVLTTIFEKNN